MKNVMGQLTIAHCGEFSRFLAKNSPGLGAGVSIKRVPDDLNST